MKKQYCIDCYLYKSEENYGYLQKVLEHALSFGVQHSDMVYRMTQSSTWYCPRYLFIFLAGKKKEYYYVTVSDRKETWWQHGMIEMKAPEFLAMTALEDAHE